MYMYNSYYYYETYEAKRENEKLLLDENKKTKKYRR
jgi:hypothetical protein